MESLTLEHVDAALAQVTEDTPVDDVALLWFTRAQLVGEALKPLSLTMLMGISEDEAEDVFARLAEAGLIESHAD